MMDGDAVLSEFDLRLRSLRRFEEQGRSVCCQPGCQEWAVWSVWLHTPIWGLGGATYVRCHTHAMSILTDCADVSASPARALTAPRPVTAVVEPGLGVENRNTK